jgi:predicted glycosyltransferase
MPGSEAAAVLVASLRDAGLPAGLLGSSIPPGLPYNRACDIALLIAPAAPSARDRLLVLSGQTASDAYVSSLRRFAGAGLGRTILAARLESRQHDIGLRAKFGYALGQDPDVLALADDSVSLLGSSLGPIFGIDRSGGTPADPALRVLLVAPVISDSKGKAGLQSLAVSRRLKVTVLTDGESKTALRKSGLALPVYHYGEVPLRVHVAGTDIAVFCQAVPRSFAMRMLLADLAASGAGLLDASDGFVNRQREPAFLPAPSDPNALAGFLLAELGNAIGDLKQLARDSALARTAKENLAALRRTLGDGEAGVSESTSGPATAPGTARPRSGTTPAPERQRDRIVFMPTNGVGLGHAQRCSLVAGELAQNPAASPVFAAFPSCLRLIKSYGFDVMPLVAKSPLHAEPFANDVVNAVRLDPLLNRTAAFVFDGGYVFNSVVQTILGTRTPSVWIRRGLWQPGQDNAVALDREKVFDRVIVPLEAFSELNEDYSTGAQIVRVGPIVQQIALSQADRDSLRSGLAERFDLSFRHLVVTMLGGGVAADRSAQTTAVAASLARRSDVLHLVVVWPTATVDPGLFCWPNTRVVRTHHASVLAAAADLFVSAVGYNSFHEALYNRIPTIFVPQMAAFMDDQRSRAVAAAERGLARLVEPHELATLDQTLARMLDRGDAEALRSRLHALDLPEPGATAAAACIADLAGLDLPLKTTPPLQRIA